MLWSRAGQLTVRMAAFLLAALWIGGADGMTISRTEHIELAVSSVGPTNPLPGFFWMGGGVEHSDYKYQGPYKGGLGEPKPGLPSDLMASPADEELWHDPDPDGICRGANCYSPDMRVPLLPWTRQDRYGCERAKSAVPALVAETAELRLTILPQYGGRIWSVYHKVLQEEMFMRNPAMQPADFAMRKAWVSGGVEWNWSPGWCGHSVFTLEPVWAGVVPSPRGDMLRVWEFDRINHTTWQVDILAEGGTLWVHPRVDNSNDKDLNGYWWTNAALRVTPSGRERIIMPAKYDYLHSEWPFGNYYLKNVDTGMYPGREDMTNFSGVDGGWRRDYSWVGNRPKYEDYFARLCDQSDFLNGSGPAHCAAVPVRSPKLPYIAHVLEDGFTTFHGHRGEGTKFYLHGAPQGDMFIQDFMAGVSDGHAEKGYYLEEQTGLTPSQSHVFPVPLHAHVEWTEWFRSFRSSLDAVHSANYTKAIESMERWLSSEDGMDLSHLAEMESFFVRQSSVPVREVLAVGMPWGGLHELLTGRPLTPHLVFPLDKHGLSDLQSSGALPWLELARDGAFGPQTLQRLPGSFEVSQAWFELLLKSVSTNGTTWLHELLLGTISLERGHAEEAERHLEKSRTLLPNPHAARNLAFLAASADAAWAKYLEALDTALAWDAADPLQPQVLDAVARELAEFALTTSRLEELGKAVLPRLPPEVRVSDPVQFALAEDALRREGDWRSACQLIEKGCWPTYVQSRSKELVDLWRAALQRRYEAALQRKLRPSELHRMRLHHGVPLKLGGVGGSCFDDTFLPLPGELSFV